MEMMNTKEVAEYLGIHEKQVYALIKDNKIPCTRVTGKWIFPRHLIDRWIEVDALGAVSSKASGEPQKHGFILAAGSNDPILDVMLNRMKEGEGRPLFSSSTGSTEGLRLLSEGTIDIAWCHLFDPSSGLYNIPFVESRFADGKIAVVHLFYREIGFILHQETCSRIDSFRDIGGSDITFINRQKGSGTRIFIDYNLEKEGIDPAAINGYDREVFTHMEVALAIHAGSAGVGVGTGAVSRLLGLPFKPIVRESFDMVLLRDFFFSREIQHFIETLQSDRFRSEVEPLGYYDFGESGKILYPL